MEVVNGRIERFHCGDNRPSHPKEAAGSPRTEFQKGQPQRTRAKFKRVTSMVIVSGHNQSSSLNCDGHSKDSTSTTVVQEGVAELRELVYRDNATVEVVHDLRNILNVVSMLTELALLELPGVSPVNDTVHSIKSACGDASSLCNRIMDASRVTSETAERGDLSTVIRAIAPLLAAYVPTKSTLHFDLAAETPFVHGAVDGIRRLLMNLVKNAAESLGDQAGSVTVSTGTIGLDSKGAVVSQNHPSMKVQMYSYLAITDTGCGMDEATQTRLLEQSFTTKSGGHGLGMASVRRIVDGCGGLIQVCSQVGYGTQIRVLFPQG